MLMEVVVGVFESTKLFWSFRGKTALQPKPDTIELNDDDSSNVNKTTE